MTRRRLAIVMVMVLGAMVLPTATALGAPPANDTFEQATIIDPAALPFEDTVDTTEATTNEFDAAAAAQCQGPPAADAAVWYAITPDQDSTVLVSTEGTDYTAGILVYSGDPIELETCAPGSIQFFALEGVTHYMMIIDDQGNADGINGGTLQLSVNILLDEVCPGLFLDDPEFAGANVIVGTDGEDELSGTSGTDLIVGKGGNDTIHGLGGDDFLAGCAGDDDIDGGNGNDQIAGDDLAFFGQPDSEAGGDDTLYGGPGNDEMLGGPGDDTMFGGPGNDGVIGNQGDDMVSGDEGDDFVAGGFGEDEVSGGNGQDFLSGGWDSDVLSGGNGKDFLNGDAPAFGPDGDPDPNEVDTCDGGNAKNEVINCEA